MHARGVGHVLVDHLDDAERRHLRRRGRAGRRPRASQRIARRRGVEPQRPAGEARGVVAAERQVGIGHRRFACRRGHSRPGPGSAPALSGPTAMRPIAVDMRDRAAAGADLHHLDHRDAQRQAGALPEASDARDLEGARGLRLAVIDQADLRRRAAHVERQHVGRGRIAARSWRRRSRRRPGRFPPGGSGSGTRSRSSSARRRTA